jgi:hypothetical protein
MRYHRLLAAGAFAAAAFVTSAANAVTVVSFGSTGDISATNNVSGTTTTIAGSVSNAIIAASPPGVIFVNPEIFSINATSVGAAFTIGGNVLQHFSGTFCFSSLSGCAVGSRLLYGTFSDGVFGGLGGSGLTLQASDTTPGESVSFFSDNLVMQKFINSPQSINLGFSDIATPPGVHLTAGGSIAAFTANPAGTFSGTPIPIPGAAMLFGSGLAGVMLLARRRKAQARPMV